MKRWFITAGAPSHSPRKSRVVEVICTRLSILITSPQKAPYILRYAKIVQRYNEIRNRVMGCPQIIERTGVSLYQINETTLSLWLKDRTRYSEIQLLLQGANLCTPPILSATALPPSKSLEVLSAAGETPVNPMIFAEPSDCTGLAKVRQHEIRIPTLGEANSELEAAVTIQDESQPPKKISRTTQWRKRAKELKGDAAQVKKPRKEYSCTKCHMLMSSDGHTQFKGKRFCSAS
ncbi:hypothetical protein GHT06_009928 [Daphnia sinensis]|uniref:Uncharacterized protein n=1 Tax=Daphnia sinensis TaxID=1820382 RepID=A0AAD5KXK4_9CRUS|nr:hypothetical protein GHT06_009928 [Daphnia sinensis]